MVLGTQNLPESYGPAAGEDRCGTCAFWAEGVCRRWNAPVIETFWCQSYEAPPSWAVPSIPLAALAADALRRLEADDPAADGA